MSTENNGLRFVLKMKYGSTLPDVRDFVHLGYGEDLRQIQQKYVLVPNLFAEIDASYSASWFLNARLPVDIGPNVFSAQKERC